jgi:hypothetical protein
LAQPPVCRFQPVVAGFWRRSVYIAGRALYESYVHPMTISDAAIEVWALLMLMLSGALLGVDWLASPHHFADCIVKKNAIMMIALW